MRAPRIAQRLPARVNYSSACLRRSMRARVRVWQKKHAENAKKQRRGEQTRFSNPKGKNVEHGVTWHDVHMRRIVAPQTLQWPSARKDRWVLLRAIGEFVRSTKKSKTCATIFHVYCLQTQIWYLRLERGPKTTPQILGYARKMFLCMDDASIGIEGEQMGKDYS